jgi:hypothetical protein
MVAVRVRNHNAVQVLEVQPEGVGIVHESGSGFAPSVEPGVKE